MKTAPRRDSFTATTDERYSDKVSWPVVSLPTRPGRQGTT